MLRSDLSTRLALTGGVLFAYFAAGYSVIHVEGLPRWVRNGAERGADAAISFPTPGTAFAERANWVRSVAHGEAFTITLQVQAYRPSQTGPARIFTVSRGTSLRDITFGQEGTDLEVRLRTTDSNLNGSHRLHVRDVFGDGERHTIQLSVRDRELSLEVDGTRITRERLPESPFSNWDPRYPVLLGNELGGQRPWVGAIDSAAVEVGGQRLDYARSHDVRIPSRYWALGPADPGKTSGHGLPFDEGARDILLNLFGLLPLGVILALLWPRTSVSKLVALCAVLSLLIEGGQFLNHARTPQARDVVLNVLGGAAGILIARRLPSAFRRGPGSRSGPAGERR